MKWMACPCLEGTATHFMKQISLVQWLMATLDTGGEVKEGSRPHPLA